MQLVRRIDIHRRKSDFASKAPAGDDAAIDEVRSPEGQRNCAHRPFVDRIADDRAGDADPATAHFVDALHGKSKTFAGSLQFFEVALASRSETKIAADS